MKLTVMRSVYFVLQYDIICRQCISITFITTTLHFTNMLKTPPSPPRVLEPSLATKKELQAFHSSAYINFLDTHNNHSSDDDDDLLLLGAESEEMEVFGLGK